MVKNESREILSRLKIGKEFWQEAVKDVDLMLQEARKRVKELEATRQQFKRNEAANLPRPGENQAAGNSKAGTDSFSVPA